MNYRKDRWYNPADKSVPHHETFDELSLKSIVDVTNEFKAFHQYLFENRSLEALLSKIGNRSYKSGLPLERNKELKYFQKDF